MFQSLVQHNPMLILICIRLGCNEMDFVFSFSFFPFLVANLQTSTKWCIEGMGITYGSSLIR